MRRKLEVGQSGQLGIILGTISLNFGYTWQVINEIKRCKCQTSEKSSLFSKITSYLTLFPEGSYQ